MMVSVALLGAASTCAAQDADDVNFLARRAAERCRRGEYERGLELFRQALDHGRTARALGEMGACELRVARWTDAETHLRDALALIDDPWLQRHRADAIAWLAEAQSHVARLHLIGGVPGAEVRVGERVVGTLPMAAPVLVTPGITQVEVRAAGHRTWRRALEVPGGGVTRETVSLERDVPSEASSAPPPAVVCGPGSVLRSGLCYATEESAASRRGVRPWQVVTWIGGGIALIAGAAALGLGAAGASEESGYLQRCGGVGVPLACVRDRADTQAALDDRAGVVNGLAATAVVGVALAVTAFMIDRAAPRTRAVAFGPTGLRVQW
ncbi:MAG: tetratricopeptide repeat protein [Deltaproteobacteria bacterium]|nr:tetratricopeptide repeat protein [Myxococcales bacterium]MDP3218692.1 tetratricopeptide repeat protein [Deltaproteobacteria bacterium]